MTVHIPNSEDSPLCGAPCTRNDPVSTNPGYENADCLRCWIELEKRNKPRRVRAALSGIKPWEQ